MDLPICTVTLPSSTAPDNQFSPVFFTLVQRMGGGDLGVARSPSQETQPVGEKRDQVSENKDGKDKIFRENCGVSSQNKPGL